MVKLWSCCYVLTLLHWPQFVVNSCREGQITHYVNQQISHCFWQISHWNYLVTCQRSNLLCPTSLVPYQSFFIRAMILAACMQRVMGVSVWLSILKFHAERSVCILYSTCVPTAKPLLTLRPITKFYWGESEPQIWSLRIPLCTQNWDYVTYKVQQPLTSQILKLTSLHSDCTLLCFAADTMLSLSYLARLMVWWNLEVWPQLYSSQVSRYLHNTWLMKYYDLWPHIHNLAPFVVLNNSCCLTHNAKREVLPCQVDSFANIWILPTD